MDMEKQLFYSILYNEHEHLWILVSVGGLGTNPPDTEGGLCPEEGKNWAFQKNERRHMWQ